MTRLETLEQSLLKKQAEFDQRLDSHFSDVRSANGQPLNDKRNGASTMKRWDRQNDSLRKLNESIEKTKAAIEREKSIIKHSLTVDVPLCLRGFVDSGQVTQWRKHPRFFFVTGVETARIVLLDDGKIAHRYVKEISNKEQFAVFRDVYNAAKKIEASTGVVNDC